MISKLLPRQLKKFIKRLLYGSEQFTDSASYWDKRYKRGGNSGTGSYNRLAEFKGEVINGFVNDQQIRTVIELGCGDGHQLHYYRFNTYTGYDVSIESVKMCRKQFADDNSKQFKLVKDYVKTPVDLAMSIDVIYHLIEDSVYDAYMKTLFDGSALFVIVYSSDTDVNPPDTSPHVKQRQFSRWVADHASHYTLLQHIPNKYPYNGDEINSSISDFYIYKRQTA